MLDNLAWMLWGKIPKEKEELVLNRLKQAVIILWVLAISAGFFCAYRYGEYMQTKRFIQQGWNPVIIIPVQAS